ncbi:hypothetical protein Tco_1071784 [Tanacetum coccineum]
MIKKINESEEENENTDVKEKKNKDKKKKEAEDENKNADVKVKKEEKKKRTLIPLICVDRLRVAFFNVLQYMNIIALGFLVIDKCCKLLIKGAPTPYAIYNAHCLARW